jgi:hypothetical protein
MITESKGTPRRGRDLFIAGFILYLPHSVTETFAVPDRMRAILSLIWLLVGLPMMAIGVVRIVREERAKSREQQRS